MPNSILYHADLNPTDKVVLMALRDHGMSSFPSYDLLADLLSIGRSTVYRSIERLVELGFVLKQSRGHRRTNLYTLVEPGSGQNDTDIYSG
jgi:predicted transcriptional regulator